VHSVLHSFPTRRSSDLIFNCSEMSSTSPISYLILLSSFLTALTYNLAQTISPFFFIYLFLTLYVSSFPSCIFLKLVLDSSRSSRSEEHTSELQSRDNLV